MTSLFCRYVSPFAYGLFLLAALPIAATFAMDTPSQTDINADIHDAEDWEQQHPEEEMKLNAYDQPILPLNTNTANLNGVNGAPANETHSNPFQGLSSLSSIPASTEVIYPKFYPALKTRELPIINSVSFVDFSKIPVSVSTSIILPYLKFKKLANLERTSKGIQSLIRDTYPQVQEIVLSTEDQSEIRKLLSYRILTQKKTKQTHPFYWLNEFAEFFGKDKGTNHLKQLCLVGQSSDPFHSSDTHSIDTQELNRLLPHLKELRLLKDHYYSTYELQPKEWKALSLCTSLRKLTYQCHFFALPMPDSAQSFLSELKHIKNLQVLILEGFFTINNNYLKQITDCTQLDSIYFTGEPIDVNTAETSFFFQTAFNERLKRCNIEIPPPQRSDNPYPVDFINQVADQATALHTLILAHFNPIQIFGKRDDTREPESKFDNPDTRTTSYDEKKEPLFTALKHLDITGCPTDLFNHQGRIFQKTPQLETLVLHTKIPPVNQRERTLPFAHSLEEAEILKYHLAAIGALAQDKDTIKTLALLLESKPKYRVHWLSNSDFILFSEALSSLTNLETLILEVDLEVDFLDGSHEAIFIDLIEKLPNLKTLEIVSRNPLSENVKRALLDTKKVRPGVQIISAPIRYTRLPTDLETW